MRPRMSRMYPSLDAAPARSLSYGISTRCTSQGEGGRHGEIVIYVQRRSHSIGKGLRFRMMEQLHHPPLWQLRIASAAYCRVSRGDASKARITCLYIACWSRRCFYVDAIHIDAPCSSTSIQWLRDESGRDVDMQPRRLGVEAAGQVYPDTLHM